MTEALRRCTAGEFSGRRRGRPQPALATGHDGSCGQRRDKALFAYGLSDCCHHIVQRTQPDDVIALHGSQSERWLLRDHDPTITVRRIGFSTS